MPCTSSSRLVGLCGLLVGLLCAGSGTAQSVYDFEALGPGLLVGQDGWTAASVGASPAVTNGIGTNVSNVIDLAVGVGIAGRANDATFAMQILAGDESSVVVEVDGRVDWAAGRNAFFGLAPWADVDADSLIDYPSETGPLFGFTYNVGVEIPNFYVGDSGGGQSFQVEAAPVGVDPGDWIRLRLEMDLTANAGSGTASLFFLNLTEGETTFRSTGIEGFDLGLATGPAPSEWDGVSVRIDDGGPGPTSLAIQLDRIAALPEPSGAALLAVGAGALHGFARRRRTRAPRDARKC